MMETSKPLSSASEPELVEVGQNQGPKIPPELPTERPATNKPPAQVDLADLIPRYRACDDTSTEAMQAGVIDRAPGVAFGALPGSWVVPRSKRGSDRVFVPIWAKAFFVFYARASRPVEAP